jgi:hypothetical protein
MNFLCASTVKFLNTPKAIFFFLFLMGSSGYAQENLILNPGFEADTSSQPIIHFNQSKNGKEVTLNWFKPNRGTTDFWNSDSCRIKKAVGYGISDFTPVKAHSGEGRVGAIFYNPISFSSDKEGKKYGKRLRADMREIAKQKGMVIDSTSSAWVLGEALKELYDEFNDKGLHTAEYISTELKSPLESGKSYYCEYFIRLDAASGMRVLNAGAYFSGQESDSATHRLYTFVPQVLCTDTSILNSTAEWKKVSDCFIAKGGEKYVTAGTFGYEGYCPAVSTDVGKDGWRAYTAYYYMDDFLLIEDGDNLHCKNEWPENQITLLIDVSNSMFRDKHIEQLKKEVGDFITNEGANSKITVITFGSGIDVYASNQNFKDSTEWNKLFDTFKPSGGTNIGLAIGKSFFIADSLKNPAVHNQIVLFTDAKFELDKETAKTIIHGIKDNKVEFDLYQLGKYRNEELNKAIHKAGGEYTHSSDMHLQKLMHTDRIPVCDSESLPKKR